ncbi:MAG: hypothetical protein QOK43_1190 [Acidimicrobiaceae bacterium]|nr:hypothetical protein [Acidimicrobiaceae bacterium]
MDTPDPVVPDYGGACISSIVPALLDAPGAAPDWLPAVAWRAPQVVLLVLDGLGWEQLQERCHLAPTLAAMQGGPITSVAPSTTATALTSIATGRPPADHGILGYRIAVGHGEVLNVLRWSTGAGDARQTVPPGDFQRLPPFAGIRPPVITKAHFVSTGFTLAHLGGVRIVGWRVPSTIAVEVARLLRDDEPFVYAYYDGIDSIAHSHGFGPHYDAELVAVDRLVSDVLDALPPGATLVVTADHGQVQVGNALVTVDEAVSADVEMLSGEARFRWLHVRPGTTEQVAARALDAHGHVAWVHTRDEVADLGWLGGPLAPDLAERVGDVAIVAFAPVAFVDPADSGQTALVCRHGSLTSAEALVPLLAARP